MRLRALTDLPRRVLTGLVLTYRYLLQPWLGNVCRYEPTCSSYALQALQQHGALRGSVLAGWRVLRCNPWCQGGHDPVPGAEPAAPSAATTPPSDPSSQPIQSRS